MRAEREESPTLAAIYKMFEEEAEAKGLEKGLERGLEKGMEKGIEKGMEKGMEKGLAEGEAKGEERGIQIAKENVAINLINEGFSDLKEKNHRRLLQFIKCLKKKPKQKV